MLAYSILRDSAHDVAVDFASLGLKGKVTVRDLWKKADVGSFQKTIQTKY